MANLTILRNIAADAAWILDKRLNDKRRSKPFYALADRIDNELGRDLGNALERAAINLREKYPAVAEELDQCHVRWRQEMKRP